MAKEPAELMENVLKMEGVKYGAVVSKEDGSILKVSDEASGNLGEVVAFIGSAAEVMTSSMELGSLSSVVAEGEGHKLLIIPVSSAYLGVSLEGEKMPWWATQLNPVDFFYEDRMAEISEAEELLKQKVNLLNLLLEEFGAKGDKAGEWQDMLAKEIKNIDTQGRLDRLLEAGPGFISARPGAKTTISKKEVGDAFEKLVNVACKKAIAAIGFAEVKQKFQAVISRLALDKR